MFRLFQKFATASLILVLTSNEFIAFSSDCEDENPGIDRGHKTVWDTSCHSNKRDRNENSEDDAENLSQGNKKHSSDRNKNDEGITGDLLEREVGFLVLCPLDLASEYKSYQHDFSAALVAVDLSSLDYRREELRNVRIGPMRIDFNDTNPFPIEVTITNNISSFLSYPRDPMSHNLVILIIARRDFTTQIFEYLNQFIFSRSTDTNIETLSQIEHYYFKFYWNVCQQWNKQVPYGIFWRLNRKQDLTKIDYLTTASPETMSSRNFHLNWKDAVHYSTGYSIIPELSLPSLRTRPLSLIYQSGADSLNGK